VLTPVLKNGEPVLKPDPLGRPVPVVTRLRTGELYELLQKEVAGGFTGTMLALDEAAQRIGGDKTTTPTWLYLSVADGGYARLGFFLSEGATERYLPDAFVDLVVDARSIADGDFEEIFAHEMGHVFLRRLLPNLPEGYSRTPHSSLSVTDYPTAFDEGFAIHFQGVARRLTRNPSLREQDLGLQSRPLVTYWQSDVDRSARIDGMRRNWFVQLQTTPPGAGDVLARRNNSTLFDMARLKNGNQMMSSEGVIATLFYRWLAPGPEERAEVVKRYSRVFNALREVSRQQLVADTPVFFNVLEKFCDSFAADCARATGMVVDTTYGVTTDWRLVAPVEHLASQGRLGDMRAFVTSLEPTRSALNQLHQRVAAAPSLLRAGLGPDVWLLCKSSAPGMTINLNTAEREEFLLLPGFHDTLAQKALDSRRRNAPFRDVKDFVERLGIAAENADALEDCSRAMQREGTYFRR
jgi:hypothetical protein